MKKIILFCLLLAGFVMAGCKAENDECCIHGKMSSSRWDGKCIYLIAVNKEDRLKIGIDSAFVKNGRFEFKTHKRMMGIIRMDWHYRYGTQDLLVVVEPGDVNVTIDSVSSGGGTKNNDALQNWKVNTETFHSKTNQLRKLAQEAILRGDSVTANTIKGNIEKLTKEYRKNSRSFAKGLSDGPFKTFLEESFPKTYKRQMPDGSIKEFSLD